MTLLERYRLALQNDDHEVGNYTPPEKFAAVMKRTGDRKSAAQYLRVARQRQRLVDAGKL